MTFRLSIHPNVVPRNRSSVSNRGLTDDAQGRQRRQKKSTKAPEIKCSPQQKKIFSRFFYDLYSVGVDGELKLYEKNLKSYVPPTLTRNAFDLNKAKNRYQDVICADSTRIVLNPPGPDYIHANYVCDPYLKNPFICTQAPMKATIVDFWRMVIQEKTPAIIMLCDLIETGKVKCEPYWPEMVNTSLEFENIKVECIKKNIKNNVQLSGLAISVDNKLVIVVKHMLWRHWPDRGVPPSMKVPLFLLSEARLECGPILVHCSAGVGRTGTLVTTEIVIQRLLAGQSVDLIPLIQSLRSQRAHFVQIDIQLLFICTCVFAYAKSTDCLTPELKQKALQFEDEFKKVLTARKESQNYTPLVPTNGAWSVVPIAPVAEMPASDCNAK